MQFDLWDELLEDPVKLKASLLNTGTLVPTHLLDTIVKSICGNPMRHSIEAELTREFSKRFTYRQFMKQVQLRNGNSSPGISGLTYGITCSSSCNKKHFYLSKSTMGNKTESFLLEI